MRFEGKTVAVTGASRGIGREIAMAFAREGAHVACIATSEKSAGSTADAIKAAGFKASAHALDVSQSEAVAATFKEIEAEHGAIYCLVNNAGIAKDQLLMRMSDDDFDAVIAVNLRGAYLCCKAVSRGMMKAREGRIINISSINGLHGAAGQANYAASKAGLIGLTKALAKELGARGITCNAVAPGFIQTDMTDDLPEEMKEHVTKTAPIGRLGTGEDIAPAVLFFASAEAGYITGQTLVVDGGLTM